jgi:HAE1 family hydrophobic/amphiphilic exporter-1
LNPARFTVARPIFTVMITLIAVSLGALSLQRLPIDLMPDIAYPTLTISTSYENAGPEEVEQLITRLVESAVAVVPGVEQITSTSSEGESRVRVSFGWGADLDAASNDLRDRLDRIADSLPEDASRPQLRKFDVAAFPIMVLGVASRLDPIALRQLVDERMSYRLERLPGVAAVDVYGGLEREVHVDLDPGKLQALGLSLEQIRTAIQDANLAVPAGELERGNLEVRLRTPGELASLDELRDTVVAVRAGAPIHLRQIANVESSHRRVTRIVRIDGAPGIQLAIRKQSGSNTVAVAAEVRREVEALRRDFPQIAILPVIDSSVHIQRSIDNLGRTLLYGSALAILVLLLFLRNLRSTLVIATAIPISVIATFALVYFGGFTLNLMTLGGLALGVGMMVDNAIVVLESIVRRREQGEDEAGRAAVAGTGEVAAAITASTLTTLVVFLPMVLLEGQAGIMFRQLAYVVGFALLCSLGVALTLVPMLTARLRAAAPRPAGVAPAAGWLERGYARLLDGALGHRAMVLTAAGMLLAASLALIPRIGTEFMPASDEGEVRIALDMQPGTRLAVLDERLRAIEAALPALVPEAQAAVLRIDAADAEAEIRLALVPAAERSRSSEQIAADLRARLGPVPGGVLRTRAGQGLFMLRTRNASEAAEHLEIQVRGFDLATLDQLAAQVRAAIEAVPGVTDVRLGRDAGTPQELIQIDRTRAADLGVSVAQIARTIETAVAGSGTGQYREGGDEFRILVRLADAERLALAEILDLTVPNDAGEAIALRNLVTVESGRGPLAIVRQDQQRVATVDANIAGRDLGAVALDIQARLRALPTPSQYDIVLGGDWADQQAAFRELLLNLLLALALVYMVMACLYESLLDPLIVMATVPLAVIGVVLTLLATGTTFNVQSFIGCIMLVGIVVNNAILIVDQAGRLRRDAGLAPAAAARAAGLQRLRPILMTTLTTALALLPLGLGIGEGAETQAPLARAVIGGLTSSTVIILVLIPAIYALAHRAPAPAASARPADPRPA